MAKKQKCPEFENHERWLVAFADMMTLLFALFVVLHSIANVEMEKLKKVSASISKAFGDASDEPDAKAGQETTGNSRTEGIFNKTKGNTDRESMMTRNRREMAAIIAADMKKIEREIEERLYGPKNFADGAKKKLDERVVYVNKDQDGIRVTLLARKFFKPNQTVLDDESRFALDGVAAAIKETKKTVRIEGHTDSIPFNMNGMTNWELSASRASAVVRYFIDKHKYPRQSIYAAGFADTRPVAANDTPDNRSLNRRVDIKILYEDSSEYIAPDESNPEGESDSSAPAKE